MKCRLCLKERELCDSHVIPEFMYRPGYDDKHRLAALTKNFPQYRYIQQGLYEKLLCKECEGLLNERYEKYFKQLWYDQKAVPSVTTGRVLVVEGIDYTRFKLFLLSILWRASVSSLDAFKMVSLRKHEEQIRTMLLKNNAGAPTQYPISGRILLWPGTSSVAHDLVVYPSIQESIPIPVGMSVFGGCVWYYVLNDSPLDPGNFLTANGTLTISAIDLLSERSIASFFAEKNIKRAAAALTAHQLGDK